MQNELNDIENIFKNNLKNNKVSVPNAIKSNIDRSIFSLKFKLLSIIGLIVTPAIISIVYFGIQHTPHNISGLNSKIQPIENNNCDLKIINKTSTSQVDSIFKANFKLTQSIEVLKNQKENLYKINTKKNSVDDKINHSFTSHYSESNFVKIITEKKNISGNKLDSNIESKTISSLKTENPIFNQSTLEEKIYIQKYDRLKNRHLLNDNLVEIKPKQNFKKRQFIIGIFSGANLNNANYQSLNVVNENDYNLDHSELHALNYGINLKLLTKQNFMIGLGIQNNKQQYNYRYTEFYEIPIIGNSSEPEYIYCPCDSLSENPIPIDSVYYFDPENELDTIGYGYATQDYAGKTYANYIQIPFSFGYLINYNRLGIGIQIGVNYNLLIDSKGAVFYNNSVKFFDSRHDSSFKKSYINASIGMDAMYDLNNNLFFKIGYNYSPSFNNLYSMNDIKRKIKTSNINIGIQYRFN